LRAFFALWRREVHGLLVAPFVYLLLGFWFLLNGLMFTYLLTYEREVQQDLGLLAPYLFGSGLLVWLLLPTFPPLLTLRLLAEERRIGTLEPLLTAPIGDAAVVIAKYLAACVFFLIFWGGVAALFLLLAAFGAPLPWGTVAAGMCGALLCSLLFLATGLWASSWGGNLLLAAGGGAALNYLLLFLPVLFEHDEGWLGAVARAAHIPNMLDRGFSAGLIDSYAVTYFLALAALFVYLAWVRLVSRRWVP